MVKQLYVKAGFGIIDLFGPRSLILVFLTFIAEQNVMRFAGLQVTLIRQKAT